MFPIKFKVVVFKNYFSKINYVIFRSPSFFPSSKLESQANNWENGNWEIVLTEASCRLQELLERETELIVQRITADIVNMETSIVERYGPQTAGELRNKVVEVSEHFKDHLQQRRSKKLDDITAINSGMTSREGYDEEEQFEDVDLDGLEIRITDFISKVRREVANTTSKERQITVEVEDLGPEENNTITRVSMHFPIAARFF